MLRVPRKKSSRPNKFRRSLEALEARQMMVADLVISEFMSVNDNGIRNEDGNRSDWIEIYNAGTETVNLSDWHLSDDPEDLTQWTFPEVILPAGETLLVFASDEDRSSAGEELHADFKLGNGGDFLALVRPDLTIAYQYPGGVPQVSDISYGLAVTTTNSTILATGANGRLMVPASGALGTSWNSTGFNDAGWTPVTTGVGYENDDTTQQPPVPIANSVTEFSNQQGQNGWNYGYWVKHSDANGIYAPTEFTAFLYNGTNFVGVGNHWDGTKWDFRSGATRPLTQMTASTAHPASAPLPQATHWAIRRYTSEAAGTLRLTGTLADLEATGNGQIGRILVDGVEVYSQAINNNSFNYSIDVPVSVGSKVDFVVDHGAGTDDTGDLTEFTAQISHLADPPPHLAGQFATSIKNAMYQVNASSYLRIPFNVVDVTTIDVLNLKIKYDAGFVAYINGVEVARNNSPSDPLWNSAATTERTDADAKVYQTLNISDFIGSVHNGANVLAIHGLNSVSDDSDFLISAELEARNVTLDRDNPKYFFTPTPGEVNGPGTDTLGPIVAGIQHSPAVPQDSDPLLVTATVTPTAGTISNVTLNYRVMYGATTQLQMFDDGAHGDGLAGDRVFGATIPASAATTGQMIRYFITATDTTADTTRWPQFLDPIDSEEYYGTVVANPTVDSDLPVWELFIQNPAAADTGVGTRGSLFYLGEFYDNIELNIHGQSTQGFPKKSYDLDFNRDHRFLFKEGMERMKDINLLSNYADKTKVRNTMAYEVFRDAGVPYHLAEPVRVQMNGQFFSVADVVEDGDDDYLERVGLDGDGALYKMYNTFSAADAATNGAEKKTRQNEPNTDLQTLLTQVNTANNTNYLLDNVNLAEAANYLAAFTVTANTDMGHKNYYFYRDSEGTGEWHILPWDVDLSFGHNWTSARNYFDDTVYIDSPLYVGSGNGLMGDLFNIPAFRQMYQRRLRTLMDEQLQPPGTPADQLKFEKRMDELLALMEPDITLDRAKWGAAPFLNDLPMAQGIEQIKTQFFPARRNFLYTHPDVPAAQPDIAALPANQRNIVFGAYEVVPASGNHDEEYLEVLNNNPFAVDVSGWQVSGGIQMTLQPGTVIPANSKIYLTPDAKVFRARTTGPRGGQGLLIQGGYEGHLSALGETISLADKEGDAITSVTTPNTATPEQKFLRITEIMYNPVAAGGFQPQQLEYLELMNTGPSAISLNNLKFVQGIQYNFPNQSLASGARIILAKDPAAFSAVYPGVSVLPTGFNGFLNNNSDDLRLEDSVGEPIMNFEYSDEWYPVTDGGGYSLVLRSTATDPGDFDQKESWRASEFAPGNPGVADNGINPDTILINEVLSNTGQAQGDWIELRNLSNQIVNIGGWWLSDSASNLKKFRIPAGTTIPANGYIVFNQQTHFGNAANPNTLVAFDFAATGEVAYLASGNGTLVGGYRDDRDFGGAEAEVPFGRHIKSTGGTDFVAMSAATMGAANALPKVGPVVINEVMYNPAGTGAEFIELRNITGSPVLLFDGANTWRVTIGSGNTADHFQLPPNITLPANGYALIVNMDPETFRQQHGLSGGVMIFGPVGAALSNNGELVRLSKPGATAGSYISVDHVNYDDAAPWPLLADGEGSSLIRLNAGQYGNDPVNWANGNLGGTPGANNILIDLTPPTTPGGFTATHASPTQINLGWTASTEVESTVTGYNIYRNGGLIGTVPGLSFSDNTVQPGVMYSYQVAAVNTSGTESTRTVAVHADAPPHTVADSYVVAENVSLVTTSPSTDTTMYFTTGDVWRYLVTGTDPGQTWNDSESPQSPFNYAGWGQGVSELGYGDGGEPTVIGFGPNAAAKYPTTYFRKTFSVTNIAEFSSFLLKLKRDDGAAVWINGVERIRDGLPGAPGSAPTAYSFYTGSAVSDDGGTFIDKVIDPSWLTEGVNTIAVEVHQAAGDSSDLSFDAILQGTRRRSGVLSNDVELENETMTASVVTQPANGSLTLNANGTFTYTPNTSFNGVDTFTYRASDGPLNSLPATVTITVIGQNDAPTANPGGPYSALVGANVTLDGAASFDPEVADAALTFEWDLDYDGVTFQSNATGIAPVVSFATAGPKTIALKVTDPLGLSHTATTTVQVNTAQGVVGRHLFYNQSRHDGNSAAAGVADDGAIATDKTALLPGGTATFANVSSYTRGINGLMVDIANLPGTVTAGDFDFKVGNTATVSGWAALPTAPTVSIRAGAGVGGSSRVTLIWPSGAIIKQWLQVTVKANGNTGLSTPDVFYYGNAMAESGNGPDLRVTVSDEVAARNNPYSAAANGGVPAPVTNKWDYNRDGNVSVTDQTQARANQTTVVQRLQIISVPSALSGSGLVAQGLDNSDSESVSDDIARGLAASSLTGRLSGAAASSQSSGGSSSNAGRLQAQALSAAYAEGESLAGKRRAVAADELDSDLLELLSSR